MLLAVFVHIGGILAPDVPLDPNDYAIFEHLEALPGVDAILDREHDLYSSHLPLAGSHPSTFVSTSVSEHNGQQAPGASVLPDSHLKQASHGPLSSSGRLSDHTILQIQQPWSSSSQAEAVPRQPPRYTPASASALDPALREQIHDVQDRNPDDLTAVVYGYKRKFGLVETGASSQDAEGLSSPGLAEHIQLKPPESQAMQLEPDSSSSQATGHEATGRLYEIDPSQLTNMPVLIIYQQDPLAGVLMHQLKDEMGISPTRRKFSPRPFTPSDNDAFISSITANLQYARLYREYEVEGKRLLVAFLRHGRVLRLEKLRNSAMVWEFKTDGSRAVMLCRGIYALDHNHRSSIYKTRPTAGFIVRIQHSVSTASDVLEVTRIRPENIPAYKGDSPRREGIQGVGQHTATASHFFYRRDKDLEPAFRGWQLAYIPRANWLTIKPEIELAKSDEQAFSRSMLKSFKQRSNMRVIHLAGQDFLMSHHPALENVPSLSQSFAAIWKEEKDGERESLVAVGLYPISRSQYNVALSRQSLPQREFSLSPDFRSNQKRT